jgi:hypothetical protein
MPLPTQYNGYDYKVRQLLKGKNKRKELKHLRKGKGETL